MSKRGLPKRERQKLLIETIAEDPFLNDEELAEKFNVSIQTIRLDRMELKLPELRERIKAVAEKNYAKVKSIDIAEIVGELVDLELDKRGISILETTNKMTFGRTKVVRGDIIFAQYTERND
jgi:Zn-dependent peptidase ImmA (M78 family)